MNKPVYIDWAIASKCNLSCQYCVGMEESELSREQAVKVAQDIIALKPRWVILEGGEPLLRDDIYDIGAMFKKNGIDVYVITNGNAFTPEKLNKLASFAPKVLFSIDGATAVTHESIKRGSKFDTALRWARECASLGIFQGITAVLSRQNRVEVKGFIDLAEKLGGSEIIFLPLKPFGEDASSMEYYQQYALSPQEQEETIKEIYSYPTSINIFYDEPFLWNISCKHALRLSQTDGGVTIPDVAGCASACSLYIQTMGDVRPCMFSPREFSFGNAAREPLKQIWQRMQASQLLTAWSNQKTRSGACGQCQQFESCHGCLARTVSITGDRHGADPACPLACFPVCP
jgi:radical SAM protein with 4Fe4S-binding SPASM domain